MKNKQYFLNAARERLGKPPMIHRSTPKQTDFLKRSKLVEIFKVKVNTANGKNYFTHPIDIKDIEKENSKINSMIKIFWERCDRDLAKATEVISWFAGDYGEFCSWKPSVCFRKETVADYENNKPKQQKYYD